MYMHCCTLPYSECDYESMTLKDFLILLRLGGVQSIVMGARLLVCMVA